MSNIPLAYVLSLPDGQACHMLVDVRSDPWFCQGSLLDSLVLNEFETFTQSFENIFETSLCWQSITSECCQIKNDEIELVLELENEKFIMRAEIFLPKDMFFDLNRLQFGDSLSGCRFVWNSISAKLLLSEFMLTDQEIQSLSEGALVLIDESFQSQWSAALIVGDGITLDGTLKFMESTWSRALVSEKVACNNEIKKNTVHEAHSGLQIDLNKQNYRIECKCRIDPKKLLEDDAKIHVEQLRNRDGASIQLVSDVGAAFKANLIPLGSGQAILLGSNEMHTG